MRNIIDCYLAFQGLNVVVGRSRGDVPRVARHLPLAFISRAVGALASPKRLPEIGQPFGDPNALAS